MQSSVAGAASTPLAAPFAWPASEGVLLEGPSDGAGGAHSSWAAREKAVGKRSGLNWEKQRIKLGKQPGAVQ